MPVRYPTPQKPCSVEGCSEPRINGKAVYCNKHYKRWKRHGDPLSGNRSREYKLGQSSEPEYRIWQQMIQRCHNPKSKGYRNYGKRGIFVCDEWRNSFLTFKKDMGKRPKGTSIERKNNNGPYSPENCIWTNQKEQLKNTRRNLWLTYNGKTKLAIDWAVELNIKYQTLITRITTNQWSIERALTTPVMEQHKTGFDKISYNGETKSLREWSAIFKIPYELARSRFRRGWSFEKTFLISPPIHRK
jgi:hypothetical protein